MTQKQIHTENLKGLTADAPHRGRTVEQKLNLIAKLVLSDYIESPTCTLPTGMSVTNDDGRIENQTYRMGGIETWGEPSLELEKPLDITVRQDYSLTTDPSTHFTKNQSDWVDETYESMVEDCERELGVKLPDWTEENYSTFDEEWLYTSYSPIERTILNFNGYYNESGQEVILELSILYRNAPYLFFTDREVLIKKEFSVEDFLKLNVKETLDFMFNSNNWSN